MTKSRTSLLRMFAPRSSGRRKSIPLRVWGFACALTAGLFSLAEIQGIVELADQLGLPKFVISVVDPNERSQSSAGSGGQSGKGELKGVASVIDGDTIEIHGQRIRLYAMDAPETRQTCHRRNGDAWRCGVESSRALDAFIGRSTVTCEKKNTDRYGRIVGKCSVRGEDIGSFMVRDGWAVAYRQYGKDYIALEDEARRAKRGVWGGAFDMPWDFRKKKKS